MTGHEVLIEVATHEKSMSYAKMKVFDAVTAKNLK